MVIRTRKTPARRSSSGKSSGADTRAKLLRHGRRLMAQGGLRAVTVRGVAESAQVNLGSFVYHFGTRDAFVAELVEDWYAPLYAQLQHTADEDLPPLEKIRRFLLKLAEFLAAHKQTTRHILQDAHDGEQAAEQFLGSLFGRHAQLMFRLIREAQQSGDLMAGNPVEIGISLFGATLFPLLLNSVLMPEKLLPRALPEQVRIFLLSSDELERRFEWALQGLQSGKKLSGRRATRQRISTKSGQESGS